MGEIAAHTRDPAEASYKKAFAAGCLGWCVCLPFLGPLVATRTERPSPYHIEKMIPLVEQKSRAWFCSLPLCILFYECQVAREMLRQKEAHFIAEMKQTAKEEEDEEEAVEPEPKEGFEAMRDAVLDFLRPGIQFLLRSAPPHTLLEVQDLCVSLGVKPRHLLEIYKTFHWLGQLREDTVIQVVREVPREHLIYLVHTRRPEVEGLLTGLMEMGGCLEGEPVPWDKFLYTLLRFCSLTRVELAQWYFFCATRQVNSRTIHYLTDEQLDEFFMQYRETRVPAFSAREVFFRQLELPRYYAADFVEAMQRFPQLLNPAIHLQRSIRAALPSTTFWNAFDQELAYNRKLTLEFFMIEKTHVFLRGEPPLRETCDLLLPIALGMTKPKVGGTAVPAQMSMYQDPPQQLPAGPGAQPGMAPQQPHGAQQQGTVPTQKGPGTAGQPHGTVAFGKDDYAAPPGQAPHRDFTKPQVTEVKDDVRPETIGNAMTHSLRPTGLPSLRVQEGIRLEQARVRALATKQMAQGMTATGMLAPGQQTMGGTAGSMGGTNMSGAPSSMGGTQMMTGVSLPGTAQIPSPMQSPRRGGAGGKPQVPRADLPPWLRDIPLIKR
jgi:hypothetical protein